MELARERAHHAHNTEDLTLSPTDDFEATFLEQWPRIYAHLRRVFGDPAKAEDLALESFRKLYHRPPRIADRHLVGGWVEQFGALGRLQGFANLLMGGSAAGMPAAVNIGIVSSLIMPSEALFRLVAFRMTSPAVRSVGLSLGPSLVVSVPSAWMVVYVVIYMLAALGLTIHQFSRRDL